MHSWSLLHFTSLLPPPCSDQLRISNLGAYYGVKEYWPVIDPSQSASLAIGAIEATMDECGVSSHCITVSLSCDARVVDYELACQWLEQFRRIVESPSNHSLL